MVPQYKSKLKSFLHKYKINFKEDFSLVRGLDYYCDTVFEFKSNLTKDFKDFLKFNKFNINIKKTADEF